MFHCFYCRKFGEGVNVLAVAPNQWARLRTGFFRPFCAGGNDLSVAISDLDMNGLMSVVHGLDKDAIASVTTPLRFDICAGSTVRFRVGQTGAFGTGNKEEDITYDGYVTGVRFTFDKMNSTALSQFSIGYARIAKDYEAMPAEGSAETDDWNEMPFYEGEPFGFASWTEKDFDLLS